MNNTTEKIRMFQSSSPSQWRRNAEKRLANQDERRNARKIAMQCLMPWKNKELQNLN